MLKVIKENKLSFVFIIIFFIVGLYYVSTFKPFPKGDGKEYIMQLVAFENHFSFGITAEDIEEAKNDFYREANALNSEYYINSDNHMHEYKDAKYSNHFGSYSALVLPAKLIVTAMGKYPVWAFFLTNYLLLFAAILTIFFALDTEPIKKLFLIILSTLNPAIFYLDWTHSEVYLYSFVVIGLVFFYNKKYALSILFICVASMQNLGIIPFAMMVGINFLIDAIVDYKKDNKTFQPGIFIKKNAVKTIFIVLAFIPGIIPIALTYIRFHTVNLVKESAMENKYLLHKAMDYLFDLNLGILPFEPIILILFFVMALIGLKKYTAKSVVNLIGVLSILYIISNQIQINCKMQYIMRYNVWIIPIMIFFVVMGWDEIWKSQKGLVIVGISESLLTAVVIILLVTGIGGYTTSQFAPWTKALIGISPSLYNSTHGIFYSRALETGTELYYSAKPVCYTDAKGRTSKILLSKEAEKLFYSDDFILLDSNKNAIDKNKLSSVLIDEGDFRYINITEDAYVAGKYRVGEPIYFNAENGNASDYFLYGLSGMESGGTWTDGKRVEARLCVEQSESLVAKLDVGMVWHHPQRCIITVNGNEVYNFVVEDASTIEFEIIPDSGIIDIVFCLPDSISPIESFESGDTRKLGLYLCKMVINEQ